MVSIWLLSTTVLLLWWLWWVPLSFLCWWWGEVRFIKFIKWKKKTNSGSKLYFVSSRNPRLQRPGTTWATESQQARHHPAQSSPWKEITMTRHDSHVQPWIILSQPPSTTHNPNSSETSRKSPRLLDLLLNLHLPPYPPIPNYLKLSQVLPIMFSYPIFTKSPSS